MTEEQKMLVECRLSGQINDAQWQDHLSADPTLEAAYAKSQRSKRAPLRPDLQILLAKANAKFAAMSAEDKARHRKAQQESWIRGELGLSRYQKATGE